ncbi:MAG TPA: DUF979 family protein [Kofleriaceae bacterium]|nr:DUF979 family protein [Kofleriaceae bacterium]
MLTLSHVYVALGAVFFAAAIFNLRERRWAAAGFWAILGLAFVTGDAILAADKAGEAWPAQAMGLGVIALAVLAALSARARARRPPAAEPEAVIAGRERSAARLGNWLFVPALAIPGGMIAIVLVAPALAWRGQPVIEPSQLALIALGVAAVIALIAALALTRSRPMHGLAEARRLLDTIGWAVILPMMLATLGAVFKDTHVGDAIARLVGAVIPTDNRAACIVAYGVGMIVFTIIMGNAFAAFPVMTAGIGLPLLVGVHHADPAALGAIGMLTGYCGTLVTPMAANFNIVPVLLLELDSEYSVIRQQWPTAVVLAVFNVILMIAVL